MSRGLPLLLLLLLPSGCVIELGGWRSPRVWVEETETLTIPSANLRACEFETHNGSVDVTGSGTGPFQVRVVKRAGGEDDADAREAMAALELVSEHSGDHWRLSWRWGQSRRSRWGASVSYEAVVPAACAVDVETHNGGVAVRDVFGSCEVETHNGALELRVGGPEVRASTHNGPVVFEGPASEVRLTTFNGVVEVRLTGSGEVAGSITTHNGSADIETSPGFSARITAHTDNGRLSCHTEGAHTTVSGRSMTVELGAAETRLSVSTHNGSIGIR